ncbi:MAG: DUF1203 domain-containing protein [Aurantibacter sp.]
MNANFKITALEANEFKNLFELSTSELSAVCGVRILVDQKPGFPCRVSLEDAEVGEEVVLFPYEHHKLESPYQAKGPIFVRKNAKTADLQVNEVPKMLEHRLLSLRVYDQEGMMIDARTLEGKYLQKEVVAVFEDDQAKYIHVHNASPGCYNCQIERA